MIERQTPHRAIFTLEGTSEKGDRHQRAGMDGMAEKASKTRLSEGAVKDALARLDWPSLEKQLSLLNLNEELVTQLLGHFRRSATLVMKRNDSKRSAARAAFVESLEAYLEKRAGTAAALFGETLIQFETIEDGYARILKALARTDAAKLTPRTQIWAALSRSAFSYCELKRLIWKTLEGRTEFSPQSLVVPDEEGATWSPDALLTGIVENATSTLLMTGHVNSWFDDGFLILPDHIVTSEEERFKAGSTELMASWWGKWKHLEERSRHFGEDIIIHQEDELPDGAPTEAERILVYKKVSDVELFDKIANQRHAERMFQTLREMTAGANVAAKVRGIKAKTPLPPHAYVSEIEAHACMSLSETLGYAIVNDTSRPGGLRLVEWIRGFSTLRLLAEARYETEGMDGLIQILPRDELTDILERVGLDSATASAFVDHASLKASSHDLFDQPLVRLRDSRLMLFGPGVIDSDPNRVTASVLASARIQLKRKGKAFEAEMLRQFNNLGYDSKAFKFKVGGEEYEYDVVVSWEDHIFVFECKNRSLSGNNPVQASYFWMEMRSAIKQVNRQIDALRRNAGLVRDRFGVDVAGKTIVPCILNSLPYALKGDRKGVYVTDQSSLSRFFSGRFFHAIHPRVTEDGVTVETRKRLAALWEGEKPTPADLMRYLADPLQIKLMLARTTLRDHSFQLDERTLVVVRQIHFSEVGSADLVKLFPSFQNEPDAEASTTSVT